MKEDISSFDFRVKCNLEMLSWNFKQFTTNFTFRICLTNSSLFMYPKNLRKQTTKLLSTFWTWDLQSIKSKHPCVSTHQDWQKLQNTAKMVIYFLKMWESQLRIYHVTCRRDLFRATLQSCCSNSPYVCLPHIRCEAKMILFRQPTSSCMSR